MNKAYLLEGRQIQPQRASAESSFEFHYLVPAQASRLCNLVSGRSSRPGQQAGAAGLGSSTGEAGLGRALGLKYEVHLIRAGVGVSSAVPRAAQGRAKGLSPIVSAGLLSTHWLGLDRTGSQGVARAPRQHTTLPENSVGFR